MSRSTSLKLAHMRSCPPSPLLTDRSPLWSDLSSADNKWPHYTMKARPIKFPSVRGVHESLQSLLLSFIFQTPPLLPNNLKIGTTIIKLIIFQIKNFCSFYLFASSLRLHTFISYLRFLESLSLALSPQHVKYSDQLLTAGTALDHAVRAGWETDRQCRGWSLCTTVQCSVCVSALSAVLYTTTPDRNCAIGWANINTYITRKEYSLAAIVLLSETRC